MQKKQCTALHCVVCSESAAMPSNAAGPDDLSRRALLVVRDRLSYGTACRTGLLEPSYFRSARAITMRWIWLVPS